MSELRMGAIESRFADIIWQNEPVTSPELVKLAAKELDWKKSTTYTVLKRLCDKGLFQNDGGTVAVAVTKAQYCALQSQRFVEDTFHGSLPAFLAAFTSGKKLTEQEIAQLRQMIAEHEEK